MMIFEWIVGVLFGAVLLAGLARRLGAPYPVFLALGGIGLAFVPAVPNLVLDPELALALFLAPVLLDAGYDTSVRDLRTHWRPIAGLAFGAVVATTAAVAVVVKWLVPDMPWAACIVLGAVVAPPDAVAALSVLRQVSLPHRLTTILRGESLLNDAGSLLIYRLGVMAAVTGSFSLTETVPILIGEILGSLVIGPVLALIYSAAMRPVADTPSIIVLQFVAAFAIWMGAEAFHLSGVLTVVTFAITAARIAPGRTPPRTRIVSYAVWDTAVFVLNVLAFVLIGLQIGPILERLTRAQQISYALVGAAVFLTVVVVRLAWVLPAAHLARLGADEAETRDRGLSAGIAVSWAGMRGIVTIATALALPEGAPAFPYRDLIVLTAFCVIIGTLTIQGLTLRLLLSRLGLEDNDPVGREVGHGRTEAFRAALKTLEDAEDAPSRALCEEFRIALEQAEARDTGFAAEALPADAARRRAIEAARDRVLALRRTGEIGDDAYYVLEEEFDWAELNATPRAET
ncbi:sodium:proton antiporter [Methylobacterium sp. 37f]|uniref:cation:proton antiporter n=1 Tax=Methylobacterium sp. 37f TaxID=2817058 RepID=UPI001FFD60C6|nr:sodium:proton antiporter [Methylobacterium sp. 37f]MCK2053907.1 sodium:proton antiporter [Methylobacterium sp. 37f]